MSCIHDSRKEHGLGESIRGCVAGVLCVVVHSQVGSSMHAPSDSRGPRWAWAVALSPCGEGHIRARTGAPALDSPSSAPFEPPATCQEGSWSVHPTCVLRVAQLQMRS